MDYFVCLIRNSQRTFVVDTGFSEAIARQRKRRFLRRPTEPFWILPTAFHVGEMVEGYDKPRALAGFRSTSLQAMIRWS